MKHSQVTVACCVVWFSDSSGFNSRYYRCKRWTAII